VKERVGAHLVGFPHIRGVFGSGIDDSRYDPKIRLVAQPLKEFEPIHARHAKVEEDDTRQRVGGAVGVLPDPLQVSPGFFSVANAMNGAIGQNPLERFFEKISVRRVVFDH
jgi:hypothetical protein